MAGYSGTPLPRKLGIKDGSRVHLVGAPAGFEALLVPLPVAVEFVDATAGGLDGALLFVTDLAALATAFTPLVARLSPAGGLWVAWPKRASGVPTDLTENVIREFGLAAGLVGNKVCAIDETWSGLRFVYRLADRPR